MSPRRGFGAVGVLAAVSVAVTTGVTLDATVTDPSGARSPDRLPWGRYGHEIAAGAAVDALPREVPAFFREARAQLVFLNPEPDRWRSPAITEMHRAWDYDHYIDFENVPDGALDAPDRYTYLRALIDAGLEQPERAGGFLPFRIVELHQRLVLQWERWARTNDPDVRRFLEARIVDDAGVLGHYVTDGSNPHHTTIHFNGWARGAPNPEGYTTERGLHARFESDFVNAHLEPSDLTVRMGAAPTSVAGSVRAAVFDFLHDSHAEVETLYRLERDLGFDPNSGPYPETRTFAADRLAAGSRMLATLWWSAYLEGTGRR